VGDWPRGFVTRYRPPDPGSRHVLAVKYVTMRLMLMLMLKPRGHGKMEATAAVT